MKACHTVIFVVKYYIEEEKLLPTTIFYFSAILPTVLLNLLILITVHRTSTLRSPSYMLLSALSFFDLLLGLVSESLAIAVYVTLSNCNLDTARKLLIANWHVSTLLVAVSLNTTMAISVERLLALKLGTRFRTVVTNGRVLMFLVLSCLFNFAMITIAIIFYKKIILLVWATLVTFQVSVTVLSYVKIFLMLKRYLQQLQPHQIHRRAVHLETYRRSVTTAVLMATMVILLYLPSIQTIISLYATEETKYVKLEKGLTITCILVSCHSLLNPMICFWRIRSLRKAFIIFLKHWKSKLLGDFTN